MSKRLLEAEKKVDVKKKYSLEEASKLVKEGSGVKFNETVEMHVRLGVDPKNTEQAIRGTVVLPAGTGKKLRVAVIAKGEKVKEAQNAGADFVGENDLIEKIQKGWMDFDVLVATPDAMKDASKLGKVLGPKGLMPNPKSGTVTFNVDQAVKELKKGRIEFKIDDYGIVHTAIGKSSFTPEQICENGKSLLQALIKAKPSSSKGTYLKSITLSSSMGPGIPVDTTEKFSSVSI